MREGPLNWSILGDMSHFILALRRHDLPCPTVAGHRKCGLALEGDGRTLWATPLFLQIITPKGRDLEEMNVSPSVCISHQEELPFSDAPQPNESAVSCQFVFLAGLRRTRRYGGI